MGTDAAGASMEGGGGGVGGLPFVARTSVHEGPAGGLGGGVGGKGRDMGHHHETRKRSPDSCIIDDWIAQGVVREGD